MIPKEKIDHSIALLKKAEPMAFEYSDKGFFLAFSGGKDSQCLYHIAKQAGVKFEAHYSLTTQDPPELVKFIKRQYPDVVIDRPKMNFRQLCLKKGLLPTRTSRFCCADLKETNGANTVTLTGVRRAESARRSKRNEFEVSNHKYSGTIDQFNRVRETDFACIGGKDKIIINPIIDWTDDDVWDYLNNVAKVPHCELYDEGWKRIGCIFCPMARKSEWTAYEQRYPKYKEALLRLIHRLRTEKQWMNSYADLTDEEIYQWYKSKVSIKHWYAENKQQQKLNFT